jgi:hypothetical protein
LFQIYLPKVDPALIHNLLIRELNKTNERSSSPPFYMFEIETEEGTDQEKMKNMIFERIGFLPSIYENGTQYVVAMRLSLELLEE